MERSTKIILLIIGLIILLVVFLYPKYSGFGYGGFVPEGEVLYRAEYSCLGFEYVTHGDRFNRMQCMDCGPTYWCAGISFGKTCYEWASGTSKDTEKQVVCK